MENSCKELLLKYYRGLVNSVYKGLPIFEGRKNKSGDIIYDAETSYRNYQIYLTNLLVEIYGNSQLFLQSENSIKLISILRGMLEVEKNDHPTVKRLTMQCIGICKKIIEEIDQRECDDIGLTIL